MVHKVQETRLYVTRIKVLLDPLHVLLAPTLRQSPELKRHLSPKKDNKKESSCNLLLDLVNIYQLINVLIKK